MSHFTVTFDYPHSRIFFAPNADTHKPFDTRTFGIYVFERPDPSVPKKTMLMLYNDPKAPVQKSGVRNFSTLLKIDGQDALKLGVGEIHRLLSPAGGKEAHDLFIIGPDGGSGHVKVTQYDPLPAFNVKL